MVRYSKLRGRIVEIFGSSAEFARKTGMSTVTVSYKLNGRRDFSRADIVAWGKALDIPAEQYHLYFFEN